MTQNDDDKRDYEPGWDMGWFLWPVALYARFKGWLMKHGLIKPRWDGEDK